nr:remorin isoform X2 [Ipomoea batatas]
MGNCDDEEDVVVEIGSCCGGGSADDGGGTHSSPSLINATMKPPQAADTYSPPLPPASSSSSRFPWDLTPLLSPPSSPSGAEQHAALAQLELEKRLALIKAWEENEKAKADNKAHKKLSAIAAWENTKKASVEAQLKQIERRQLPVRSSVVADVYVEEGRLPPLMLTTHVDGEEETVTTFSKSFLSFRICCSSTS